MELAKDVIRLSGFTTDEMPIVITGVRAGEKLEESLWEDDATVEPTAHPDILRITERQMPEGTVQTAVARLGRAAEKGDRLQAEALLCDWIPSFTPSVSSVAPRVDDLPNWSRTGRASGR